MRAACLIRWLALALLLSACQILPDRPPPAAVHDFGPARTPIASGNFPWSAVNIEAPDWLQDPMIRYRLLYAQPTQVRSYSRDRWLAPPPELLANQLTATRSPAGYDVKIKLQGFEQVFERPGRSTVMLQFQAIASDPSSGRIHGTRTFRWSRATRSADAAGAVDAFSELVEQAITALSAWIGSLPLPARLTEPASAVRS